MAAGAPRIAGTAPHPERKGRGCPEVRGAGAFCRPKLDQETRRSRLAAYREAHV